MPERKVAVQMTSPGVRLRVPLQVGPVDRVLLSAGSTLAGGYGIQPQCCDWSEVGSSFVAGIAQGVVVGAIKVWL